MRSAMVRQRWTPSCPAVPAHIQEVRAQEADHTPDYGGTREQAGAKILTLLGFSRTQNKGEAKLVDFDTRLA